MQQNCFPDVYPVMRTLFASLFLLSALLGLFVGRCTQSAALVNDSNYIYRSMQEARLYPERVFRLNLSKQRLDSIPSEIFSFTNLRELDLVATGSIPCLLKSEISFFWSGSICPTTNCRNCRVRSVACVS